MKRIFTLIVVILNVFVASAQWSNTTNLFTDSLDMPVVTALKDQNRSMSIRSYPDSGYIVYWEDSRNNGQVNVYAQKYDKAGNALWAMNGVPVATGQNARHFYSSTNGDYRNYSFAVTDSSGGCYIAYLDDSNAMYTFYRVTVQHLRSDGTGVFPGAGYVVAAPSDINFNYTHQQLIADGNRGFYIGYLRTGSVQDVFAYCFRDEGGTMKNYGGGQMDANAYLQQIGSCSNYTLLLRDAFASDFYIYPDLQHGCNVAMVLAENAGGSERSFIGYNRLVRVKKASTVVTTDAIPVSLFYPKDSVLIYYNIAFHTYIFQCGPEVGTGYVLDGNGFARVTGLTYGQTYPKGVVVPVNGTINADVLAWDERRYNDANGQLTKWYTLTYNGASEKYDSIPYEYTVFPFEPSSLVGVPVPGRDKLNYGADTIINTGSYGDYDLSLAASGNKVFFTAASYPAGNGSFRSIVLNQEQVVRKTFDSVAIERTTGTNAGVTIGEELSPATNGYGIMYDFPHVVGGPDGNALFYINETNRGPRVSPIINATELAWGAMGKPIASGKNGNDPINPFVTLDPLNGTGVICWDDGQGINAGQGENVYMRHLDSLNLVSYGPPPNGIMPLSAGQTFGNTAALLGTSHSWTTIDVVSQALGAGSPIFQVLDNYNLGATGTQVYENTGAVRNFNGVPYLDRNITILPEHNPAGTAPVNLRLFFTSAEFAALQAADPSIANPGLLAVLKQPNVTGTVPVSYTPVAGEEVIAPSAWKAVSGGYYLEITVTSFSNFFIQKGSVPLPVTWLGVEARWEDAQHARVSWQVADQENVSDYTVQGSTDGNVFVDACMVKASAVTDYFCVAPAGVAGGVGSAVGGTGPSAGGAGAKNYYRVMQRDLDGKMKYSKVVVLESAGATALLLYPNPAKEILYVSGLSTATDAELVDLGGRVIRRMVIEPGTATVNVSGLVSGTYFIRLMNNREMKTMKFVKE